jgi:hypothetical protein
VDGSSIVLSSGDDEEDDAAKSVRLVFVPILELSDINFHSWTTPFLLRSLSKIFLIA